MDAEEGLTCDKRLPEVRLGHQVAGYERRLRKRLQHGHGVVGDHGQGFGLFGLEGVLVGLRGFAALLIPAG